MQAQDLARDRFKHRVIAIKQATNSYKLTTVSMQICHLPLFIALQVERCSMQHIKPGASH